MKKAMLWILAVAAVFLSGVILFVVLIVPRLGKSLGGSGVDEWVARQVAAIANSYLVPELQFDGFEYRHPGVLELRNVRFVAPDAPRTRVVEAALLRVTLAEVPRFGKPIIIERVDLDRAALRLLRDTSTGGFKGLVPFVKGDNIRNQDSVPSDVRLSDVFKIKKLTLTDGMLQYNDGAGPEMMTLTGLALDLDVSPDPSAHGWYGLDLNLDRPPVFALGGKGRFNIDTLDAELSPLKLSLALNDQGYGALPPELQRTLKEHDARGSLAFTITGGASVREFHTSSLRADVSLEGFNVAAGEYRLPIDSAKALVTLGAGKVALSGARASLLTGAVSLDEFVAELNNPARPFSLTWNASDLELRELLRTKTTPGQPPRLAGKFNSTGKAGGFLMSVPGSLGGSGTLRVRDGRLVNIPILSDLMEAMNVLNKAMGTGYKLEDTADVDYDLTGQGFKITRGEAQTQVASARFTGTISYTGDLDLSANAGPLEKVQGLLGDIGKAVGKVTDRLMKYRITGPASDPKVSVTAGF